MGVISTCLSDYLIPGLWKPAVKNQTQLWQISRTSADSELWAGRDIWRYSIGAASYQDRSITHITLSSLQGQWAAFVKALTHDTWLM